MLDKLKALWARINQPLVDMWNKDKIFLVIFGVVILIIKFHSILINLIVNNSKKLLAKTVAKDAVLAKEENAANTSADEYVKKAEDEPKKATTVDENWYKKNED